MVPPSRPHDRSPKWCTVWLGAGSSWEVSLEHACMDIAKALCIPSHPFLYRRLEALSSSSRGCVQLEGFIHNHGRDSTCKRHWCTGSALSPTRIGGCTTETASRCDADRYKTRRHSLLALWYIWCLYPVHVWRGTTTRSGRLLQEVLTLSGDVTILAWTGKASDYNSCLPVKIGVYREPASPYIPSLIEDDKMDELIAELRTSSHLDSAMTLYDQLVRLPSPRLDSRRLSISRIMFPLRGLSTSRGDPQHIYRAMTTAIGNLEIKTMEDLSSLKNLVLVHPWLQCLLNPALPSEDLSVDSANRDSDVLSPSSSHTTSPRYDKLAKALRLFARLRQPFGALLLVPLSHNEYKRVASDHPTNVQLLKTVSPRYLAEKIRTLDVL